MVDFALSSASGVPEGQAFQLPVTNPGTIAGSGTLAFTIPTYGYPHIAVFAQISQAGSIAVQRYVDRDATIAVGTAVTQALSANTLASIDNLGTVIAQSAKVSIVNSGTPAATLTNLAVVIART